MSGGESAAHRALKRAALAWALGAGYPIGALEVRLPKCNYRADAVAYRPGSRRVESESREDGKRRREREARVGITAIFECKQSRPDFLKDSHAREAALGELRGLNRRREVLERNLRVHHPNLLRDDSLFPEFRSHDFTHLEHAGYRRVMKEIRKLENRVFGGTKFERLVRYRCANVYYLVVAEDVLKPDEAPVSWGILRLVNGGRDEESLELVRKPCFCDAPDAHRLELLHRIAARGTRVRFQEPEG